MKQMEQLSEYDQTKANRRQGDAAAAAAARPEVRLIPGLIHNQFWVRRLPPEGGWSAAAPDQTDTDGHGQDWPTTRQTQRDTK